MKTEKLIGAVYYWKNVNRNKMYIGSTLNLKHRLYCHMTESSNVELKADMENIGLSAFTFGVLEFKEFDISFNKKEAVNYIHKREQYYIDQLLTEDGIFNKERSYNVNHDVNGKGKSYSSDTKHKMSVSGKKKIISEDHKRNISLNHASKKDGWVSPHKGAKRSKEHIDRAAIGHYKKVLQYSIDGKFVKEHSSAKEASEELYVHPSNITRNLDKEKVCRGFIWKRYTENYPLVINVPKYNRIIAYDYDKKISYYFKNEFHAHKETGVSRKGLSISLKNGKPIKNIFFEYEK